MTLPHGIQRYIRLCLVGFSGTIVQLISYNIFRSVMSASWAVFFAIGLAIINNFYFHGRITFQKKGFSIKELWGQTGLYFISYQILMVFLQIEWLKTTVAWIGPSRLHENIMMFAGMVWGSLLNYLVYHRVIFSNSKGKLVHLVQDKL